MATKKPSKTTTKRTSKSSASTKKKSSSSKVKTKSVTAKKAAAKTTAKPAPEPAAKPIPTTALLFIIIAGGLFIVGFFIGVILAGGTNEAGTHSDDGDHGMDGAEKMAHSHEAVDISNQAVLPDIGVDVFKDPLSGYNVRVTLTNFEFVPEQASTVFIPNEGHAHLYINGQKETRLYGEWYHIESLPQGRNDIRVTLNSNDHKDLMINGLLVEDTAEVIV